MKFKHRTNCTVGLSVYKSHCRQIAGHRSLDLLLESGGAQHTCWLAGPVTGAAVWMAILVLFHPPPLPNPLCTTTPTTLQARARRRAGRGGGPARWGALRRRGQGASGGEHGRQGGRAQVGRGQRPIGREIRWGRGRGGGRIGGGGWRRRRRRQGREVGWRWVGAGRRGQGALRWWRSVVNGDGVPVVVGRVVKGRRLDAGEVHASALKFKQRNRRRSASVTAEAAQTETES